MITHITGRTQANDLALQIAEEVTGNSEILVLDGAYHGHSKPLMGLSSYKLRQQKEGESGIGANTHAWIVNSLPCSASQTTLFVYT